MRLPRAAGDVLPNGLVVNGQANCVALTGNQVGKSGGSGARVVEFGRPALTPKCHRLAGIEHDLCDNVGRFSILLGVEAIGTSEDLPVDVLEVVTRTIVAVLAEL